MAFCDETQSFEARVSSLLANLSLAEKVGLMVYNAQVSSRSVWHCSDVQPVWWCDRQRGGRRVSVCVCSPFRG
jgi:hypothetical protein